MAVAHGYLIGEMRLSLRLRSNITLIGDVKRQDTPDRLSSLIWANLFYQLSILENYDDDDVTESPVRSAVTAASVSESAFMAMTSVGVRFRDEKKSVMNFCFFSFPLD